MLATVNPLPFSAAVVDPVMDRELPELLHGVLGVSSGEAYAGEYPPSFG